MSENIISDPTLPELVSMSVHQGKIPRYLFKYRNLNSNFDNILLNNELWFSNPNDFNDPFDCQITIDTNNTISEIENFIVKNSQTTMSNLMVKNYAKLMMDNPQSWDKIVNDSAQLIINSSGVCCFGITEDNILMWSHYTDSHKGVCLKFDVLNDSDFFVFPMKIIYDKSYPIYNHIRNEKDIVKYLIQTKADVWAYEEEIRIVKVNKNGLYKFNKNALVEITFGHKTIDSEIERIKSLAYSNGYQHLKFKKSVLKKQQYGLDFITV